MMELLGLQLAVVMAISTPHLDINLGNARRAIRQWHQIFAIMAN